MKNAIKDAHTTGEVFRSLSVYYLALCLAKQVKISSFIYPFENRAWEKMFLLGIREVDSAVRTIGYQHASITASHMNFIFSEREAEVTPLPDVIVTMGQITRDWLLRRGHFPQALLKAGCALRQENVCSKLQKKRPPHGVKHILVALATSLNEYVLTLRFLQEAMKRQDKRSICIRPHPTIPLGKAIELFPKGYIDFPYNVSTGTVQNDLEWADVVLYASSTIGLEAVAAGIPAVYLEIGDILNTDPLGGWLDFKWISSDPSRLLFILAEIEALSESDFNARQQLGFAYANAYLTPVTDQTLKSFVSPNQ